MTAVEREYVVVGATNGDAYTYCRKRWGELAAVMAFVPVSPFSLRCHELKGSKLILLPGALERGDWEAMDAALHHAGVGPSEDQGPWAGTQRAPIAPLTEDDRVELRLLAKSMRDLDSAVPQPDMAVRRVFFTHLGKPMEHWAELVDRCARLLP